MGLFNSDSLTDITALRAITADPDLATRLHANTDLEIKAAARFVGVVAADIPVDVDGHAESEILQIYGRYVFLSLFAESLKGGVSTDDTYEDKLVDYKDAAEKARKRITYETITGNDVVKAANRIGSKPIW